MSEWERPKLELPDPSNLRPPRKFDCPVCEDLGYLYVPGGRGVQECHCLRKARRQKLLDRIPPEYRSIALDTVLPHPKRHRKQQAIITRLKTFPEAPYLFLGPAGTGKSLFCWLLYRQAVEDGRLAVCLTLPNLLRQFREAEMGDSEPAITASRLRNTGVRWFIGLDDFAMARPTIFASEMLFELLDAAYGFHHQLVVTTNIQADRLQEHWATAGEGFGASILRRIFEGEGTVEVNLFD